MFKCQECSRKFKTVKAAERASMSGCPKCGGCDIDLDNDPKELVRVTNADRARAAEAQLRANRIAFIQTVTSVGDV